MVELCRSRQFSPLKLFKSTQKLANGIILSVVSILGSLGFFISVYEPVEELLRSFVNKSIRKEGVPDVRMSLFKVEWRRLFAMLRLRESFVV